jgi:uncharacterized repeat protein (TIGR01451 family)
MHVLKSLRAALVTAVAGTALVAIPATTANAAPSTSAIEVSSTTLHPGDTFTITQTVYNAASFTIVGAKAALFGKGGVSLPDRFDLVSCTGAIICFPLDIEFRAAFGNVPSGESRTVVYTFKVKDDIAPQELTLQHQFLGDEYSFELFEGPTLTFGTPEADIAVSLSASARGLLVSRVTYTITVKNNGPADATDIRVTAAYPAGLSYAGSSNCARVGTTRTVNCDVASLASGASTTRSFSADAGLLTLGSFTATAQRTASSPSDPNAANDTASRSCTALTSLLVRC